MRSTISWVERLDAARIFASKEEADAGLHLAEDDVTRNLIVEPCLVDVTKDAGGLRPSTLREAIRAQGPTIDFLPHRRAITSDAIPSHKSPSKQAAKPVVRAAEAMTCERLDPRRVKLNLPLLLQKGSHNETAQK